MFSQQQLQIIYNFFPAMYYNENEKIWYRRCSCCFIEIAEKGDFCFVCNQNKLSELFVIEKILIKVYRKHGLNNLKKTKEILDPHHKINNIYDKCLIHVLHKPQKIKELLFEGANPDMDFGEITGNNDYTLLSWCLKENEEIAMHLFVNASKDGEIFKRRDRWDHTALGNEIVNLLRNEYSGEYYRYNIEKLIDLGADIKNETLNSCGISGLIYENKPKRQDNIRWLLEMGMQFDLEKCIVFECKKEGGSSERCSCGTKRLKETRLGKFLIANNNL